MEEGGISEPADAGWSDGDGPEWYMMSWMQGLGHRVPCGMYSPCHHVHASQPSCARFSAITCTLLSHHVHASQPSRARFSAISQLIDHGQSASNHVYFYGGSKT